MSRVIIDYKTIVNIGNGSEEHKTTYESCSAVKVELLPTGILITIENGWKKFFPNQAIIHAEWTEM